MARKTKTIFALDIGTRSIVGVLLEETKDGEIVIKDIEIEEHSNRAMLDGQIHNIPQVSSVVKNIKIKMEKNNNTRLKKVAVAAAGRSLKTIKTNISHQFKFQETISSEDVLKLELKGAQKAQTILLNNFKEKVSDYYCVGYSITKYLLDGDQIGSLIGQKGQKISLEIVAAFLPKVVVDSLQAVLDNNGLELAGITLEPIAAINAILPPTMRKLNLALVDVGAGTSDIAISSDGSIIAYGMVPFAGDEITEALCEKYLLDFNIGEKVKRQLNLNGKNVAFTDILGFEHSLECAEILNNISETIELLAKKISDEILQLNSKSPQAIILIGGGSLTPLLTKNIAALIGLPEQRVAVQKATAIKDLENLDQGFNGPEFITPLGIGLTALRNITLGFIPIKVNNFNINLLNLGKNTVLDALLSAGIDTTKLYGKPGLALTADVNGKILTIPGTMGEKAKVRVNGTEASLDTILKPKDHVEFIQAKDGKPGQGKIKDLLPTVKYVKINGEKKQIPIEVTMNGQIVSEDTDIIDGSKIYFRQINQLGELLDYWKLEKLLNVRKITLSINGKINNLNLFPLEIKINNQIVDLYHHIQPEDEISIIEKKQLNTIKDVLELEKIDLQNTSKLKININGEILEIPVMKFEIKLNDQTATLETSISDGDYLEISFSQKDTPILIDIFPLINFSLTPPYGKTKLEILINGNEAEYTTPLKHDDEITLNWI